jgi:prepilin-type N-terminal cleavage/methylation domain-containing protein
MNNKNSKDTFMKNNNAFTLIELLVVVLIIGILAAVALPQYNKAVEKSRSAQALTLLKSLGNAADTYVIANGTAPTSFDELAVSPPDWTGNTAWYSGNSAETKSDGDWSLQLHGEGIYIGRISGPYKGAGFAYYFTDNYYSMPQHEILCMERHSQGMAFGKTTGDYCQKILKGTLLGNFSSVHAYTLN